MKISKILHVTPVASILHDTSVYKRGGNMGAAFNLRTGLVTTGLASFVVIALAAANVTINFDEDEVGKPPSGFGFDLTGQGHAGVWVIQKDDATHTNVLVQTDADKTNYRFPLAIYNDFTSADVALSVRFKPIAGKGDQGAGLVWRFRDKDNYYITRCNALEDNCTIYHVVNGRRVAFQNHDVKVASNVWHTLSLDAIGNHFVVSYDGTKVLDATDHTFKDAGRVGLWTKADSVIAFDDFTITGK
jgi:hypothetical protein